MKKEKIRKADHVGFGTILAWKSRDISMAACRVIVTGQLMLYATSILKMDPVLVGMLLLASKIFDGFTDLAIGYLIDNTKTKWGQARPYELAVIGMWVSAWLLFSCPVNSPDYVKAIWVFLFYTFTFSVFQTCLAGNGTPYMVRAFGNKMVIAKISSYGGIISMIGSVMVSIFFPMVMKRLATSASGWTLLLGLFAVPMMIIGMCRFIFIKEKVDVKEQEQEERVTFKQIFQMLKVNKYAWFFAGILGVFELIQGLNVMTLYFNYIVGDVGKMGLLHAMTFILLPVMLFFPTLMKKMSVSNLIELGTGLAIVGYIINWFAGDNMVLLTIGAFMAGRCVTTDINAHMSTRNTVGCMLMGQGAGAAAALCAKNDWTSRELPYPKLREVLLKQDVILD